jgi:LacI family transcriptional regulator
MSVSIKEIAKHTGLSVPTVGNVLGRSASRYSAETRRRVAEAVRELGYRPNSSARAMRQGRFGCAALVLSRSHQQTHSYIPPKLLDGLDDELSLHNMHLTVSRLTDEELSSDEFIPKVIREHTADGIIVNYTHDIPRSMLDLIRAHHAPAVWVNAKLESDCVYPEDFGAARTVTEELLKRGHQRIALVHLVERMGANQPFSEYRPHMHYSVADRVGGYAEAMRSAGLTPRVLSHDRFIGPDEHIQACQALLNGPERPTAVLAYSENEVTPVMCAARMAGFSIPRDLSVVAFAPASMWVAGYEVSIAAVPTEEVGRRAVRMLLRRLESHQDGEVSCPPDPVPYGLVPLQTVGPLNAGAAATSE